MGNALNKVIYMKKNLNMKKKLIMQIDQAIEKTMDDLKSDLVKLIAIKSVKGEPVPGAPFGAGPRAVLDAVLDMGKQEGFYATEHTEGVISLSLKAGQPDLGIWLHGDVVPEGAGWDYDPYQATEYKGCIIGRGATDNKGQLCAIFHLLKIFKALNIPLNYNPALYVGSNEESGKHDVKAFCAQYCPPRLSLVPDSGFPVGYGGKGGLLLTFRAKKPLQNITITAGQDDAPGRAEATAFGRTIVTNSFPRHLTNPDPNGNMITRLTEQLLEMQETAQEDRPVLEFFRLLSMDIHGTVFGLDVPSETMTGLILVAKRIDMVDGCPQLQVSIRYPIELTAEHILQTLESAAQAHGLEIVRTVRYLEPYLLDKNWPVVEELTRIANEVTGDNRSPYIVGGGTYAHELPNALAFGMDGCLPPEDFPEGHGHAHGLDESVSLDRLQRAMKIYGRTLLALNDMKW